MAEGKGATNEIPQTITRGPGRNENIRQQLGEDSRIQDSGKSWSVRGREQKYLPSAGIEPQFSGRSARGVVTTLNYSNSCLVRGGIPYQNAILWI
jgi:hypothetical protein